MIVIEAIRQKRSSQGPTYQLATRYSTLNAPIGSILVARSAGTSVAISTTVIRMPTATSHADVSNGSTPYNALLACLVAHTASSGR
jgi:hypothetical protein